MQNLPVWWLFFKDYTVCWIYIRVQEGWGAFTPLLDHTENIPNDSVWIAKYLKILFVHWLWRSTRGGRVSGATSSTPKCLNERKRRARGEVYCTWRVSKRVPSALMVTDNYYPPSLEYFPNRADGVLGLRLRSAPLVHSVFCTLQPWRQNNHLCTLWKQYGRCQG